MNICCFSDGARLVLLILGVACGLFSANAGRGTNVLGIFAIGLLFCRDFLKKCVEVFICVTLFYFVKGEGLGHTQ